MSKISSLRSRWMKNTLMVFFALGLICVLLITGTFACIFRTLWVFLVVQRWHHLSVLVACYPISWLITFLFQLAAFAIVFRRHTQKVPEAEELE